MQLECPLGKIPLNSLQGDVTPRGRKIIHVDMDCFYAACEVKHRPELRGKALGVGGPAHTRSVLCTASYEARKFGVRAAMPSSMAKRLCPQLILVPPNFELYRRESTAVHEIFSRFSCRVEALSLDEAYLDVSDSRHFRGSATLIAQEIRRLIWQELRLTASAGVASNKFLAKVASDWEKPNGIFVIRPDDIDGFVKSLAVEKIPGVGPVSAKRLHELGIKTCADIQRRELKFLTQHFGVRGEDLFFFARGKDAREVATHGEPKSLSVEETFSKDIKTLEGCLSVLPALYRDWESRLLGDSGRDRIRGLLVKIKFFDFKSTTHEMASRAYPTLQVFETLVRRAWARGAKPVRLIGLGARLGEAESLPYQLKFSF